MKGWRIFSALLGFICAMCGCQLVSIIVQRPGRKNPDGSPTVNRFIAGPPEFVKATTAAYRDALATGARAKLELAGKDDKDIAPSGIKSRRRKA